MRRYSTYCKNYGENKLYKIACGPAGSDYHWMEVLMQNGDKRQAFQGISLHYYTGTWGWENRSATDFGEDLWFRVLEKALEIDEIITKHKTIMDKYDPDKKVALVVDEWGTWYNVEPGTNPGFLFQQNTMRDAFVAALSLNYFNAKCDRIKMANIAQTVNVLQALIFTKEDKMVLTPTYHVFEMFKVHHDATLIPLDIDCGNYSYKNKELPALSASASKDKNGVLHVSLVNIDPKKSIDLNIDLKEISTKKVKARILTSSNVSDHNTFEEPDIVVPIDFSEIAIKNKQLIFTMPAKSIICLDIQ
jgi:alpha-N-arabinofuranosidase